MGEVVATSLDYLTSQSQGQIPTDDKIIAAIKEAMVAMSVEGDIETRRGEILKIAKELIDD